MKTLNICVLSVILLAFSSGAVLSADNHSVEKSLNDLENSLKRVRILLKNVEFQDVDHTQELTQSLEVQRDKSMERIVHNLKNRVQNREEQKELEIEKYIKTLNELIETIINLDSLKKHN